MKSRLVSRNITVNGRRTSMRLEEACWEAIDQICTHEGVNLNVLCSAIDQRTRSSSRTAAVRAFIVTYFRDLAMDHGLLNAGRVMTLIPELAGRAR